MTVGSGYHTYEIERGAGTGKWLVYHVSGGSSTYIGQRATKAAAEKLARSQATRGNPGRYRRNNPDKLSKEAKSVANAVMNSATPGDLMKSFGVSDGQAFALSDLRYRGFGPGGKGWEWVAKQANRILKKGGYKRMETTRGEYRDFDSGAKRNPPSSGCMSGTYAIMHANPRSKYVPVRWPSGLRPGVLWYQRHKGAYETRYEDPHTGEMGGGTFRSYQAMSDYASRYGYAMQPAPLSNPSHTRSKHAALLTAGDFEGAARVWKRSMAARKRKNPLYPVVMSPSELIEQAYRFGKMGAIAPHIDGTEHMLKPDRLAEVRRLADAAYATGLHEWRAAKRKNPVEFAPGIYLGAPDMEEWAKKTTDQLVKNARFWIGTGMTPENALAKVFSQSLAGPRVQSAVRAQVLGHSNPRKRNPLGGPLTITHDGADLLIRHTHGNPRKRVSWHKTSSTEWEVLHYGRHLKVKLEGGYYVPLLDGRPVRTGVLSLLDAKKYAVAASKRN